MRRSTVRIRPAAPPIPSTENWSGAYGRVPERNRETQERQSGAATLDFGRAAVTWWLHPSAATCFADPSSYRRWRSRLLHHLVSSGNIHRNAGGGRRPSLGHRG